MVLKKMIVSLAFGLFILHSYADTMLKFNSEEVLVLPKLSEDSIAEAGKMVKITPVEYKGTNVYHTIYLPKNWKKDGEKLPIIFEYTGNKFLRSGSTGKVEDAALGYGISGGKYIWVSLPCIENDRKNNAVTWWGDEKATVEYAKVNVTRIIKDFNADSNAVFLCGFSRGAIGVNYLGLYDDEVAKLWTAFITHDHFDGALEWKNTSWGTPLEKYQTGAKIRLARVGDRPYWVSYNGDGKDAKLFLNKTFNNNIPANFHFGFVNVSKVFDTFPNDIAKSAHTDKWPLLPSAYRNRLWLWMNNVIKNSNK